MGPLYAARAGVPSGLRGFLHDAIWCALLGSPGGLSPTGVLFGHQAMPEHPSAWCLSSAGRTFRHSFNRRGLTSQRLCLAKRSPEPAPLLLPLGQPPAYRHGLQTCSDGLGEPSSPAGLVASPSRLCLHVHMASQCLCLSSVPVRAPDIAFRATLIQEDLISDLAPNPTCKHPNSK